MNEPDGPNEPYDFISEENESCVPFSRLDRSSPPAEASITRLARTPPLIIGRPGLTSFLTETTRHSLSRKMRSIENFIPTVCTEPQRSITIALPFCISVRPSSPRRRSKKPDATSTGSAKTLSPRINFPVFMTNAPLRLTSYEPNEPHEPYEQQKNQAIL